jgi:hypothetical protein
MLFLYSQLELSIFRAGPGSGQAENNFQLFRAEKILPLTIPLDAPDLNFRAGLGRVARTFYSVKQLKTAFRAGLGQKKFRGIQDLCPRPPSKVRGRAWCRPGGAGFKMLRYILNYIIWLM